MLANLTDPDYSAGDENSASTEHKRLGTDVVVMLAVSFGSKQRGGPLQALTVWDRIETALRVATTSVDDGDLDRFATVCLEHCHAVQHLYARSDGFMALLAVAERPASWRQAFMRYVSLRIPPLIGNGRLAYEAVKRERGEWVEMEAEDGTKTWARKMPNGEIVVKGGDE